jgi:hypothetical protein
MSGLARDENGNPLSSDQLGAIRRKKTQATTADIREPIIDASVEQIKEQLKSGEVTADLLDIVKIYEATGQLERGIPSKLNRLMREVLVKHRVFEDMADLRRVLENDKLSPWRYRIPEKNSIIDRVTALTTYLYNKYNTSGENALVLFLEALVDTQGLGAKLEAVQYVLCAYCGSVVGVEERKCSQCGAANEAAGVTTGVKDQSQTTSTDTRTNNRTKIPSQPKDSHEAKPANRHQMRGREETREQTRETQEKDESLSDNFKSIEELQNMKTLIINTILKNCSTVVTSARTFRALFVTNDIHMYRNYLIEGNSPHDRVTRNIKELFLNKELIEQIHRQNNVPDKPPAKALYDLLMMLSSREVGMQAINLERLAERIKS